MFSRHALPNVSLAMTKSIIWALLLMEDKFDKVEIMLKVPLPVTKKFLRSFPGMIFFYRIFIPHVTSFTSLLTDFLRKRVHEPLKWANDLTAKFHQLKAAMASEPILKIPDVNVPFFLRTDTSNFGIGAVML